MPNKRSIDPEGDSLHAKVVDVLECSILENQFELQLHCYFPDRTKKEKTIYSANYEINSITTNLQG